MSVVVKNTKFVLLNHDDRVAVMSHSLKRWFNSKNETHPADNLGNTSIATVVRLNISITDFYYAANSEIGRHYPILPLEKFKKEIYVSFKGRKVFTDHCLMRELSRLFDVHLGDIVIQLAREAEAKRPKKKIDPDTVSQSSELTVEKKDTLLEMLSKFDDDDYW